MYEDIIKKLEKLPDKIIFISKGERCPYFYKCPFAKHDCEGSRGKIDKFKCNIMELKRIYAKRNQKNR